MHETPDLTRYHLAHEAMRTSARQLATAVAGLDPSDTTRLHAMRWWWRGFVGELHAHHTLEDELFFPALAARVPSFAAELDRDLADEHVELDQIMSAVTSAMAGLAPGAEGERNHRVAIEQAEALSGFLDHHLGIEDDDVLPLFARHFTAAEYKVLDDGALKRIRPRQLLWTVPWAVSCADDETREQTLAEAPLPIRLIWLATRRRYLRRTALALGPSNVAPVR